MIAQIINLIYYRYTCWPFICELCIWPIVSSKLWASSIMNTLPSRRMPLASLVLLCNNVLYGKVIIYKYKINKQYTTLIFLYLTLPGHIL